MQTKLEQYTKQLQLKDSSDEALKWCNCTDNKWIAVTLQSYPRNKTAEKSQSKRNRINSGKCSFKSKQCRAQAQRKQPITRTMAILLLKQLMQEFQMEQDSDQNHHEIRESKRGDLNWNQTFPAQDKNQTTVINEYRIRCEGINHSPYSKKQPRAT